MMLYYIKTDGYLLSLTRMPYGTCCIDKHLSIDIVSLTGQNVNRRMKDAEKYQIFLWKTFLCVTQIR